MITFRGKNRQFEDLFFHNGQTFKTFPRLVTRTTWLKFRAQHFRLHSEIESADKNQRMIPLTGIIRWRDEKHSGVMVFFKLWNDHRILRFGQVRLVFGKNFKTVDCPFIGYRPQMPGNDNVQDLITHFHNVRQRAQTGNERKEESASNLQ